MHRELQTNSNDDVKHTYVCCRQCNAGLAEYGVDFDPE
jgi:hypothetical protein